MFIKDTTSKTIPSILLLPQAFIYLSSIIYHLSFIIYHLSSLKTLPTPAGGTSTRISESLLFHTVRYICRSDNEGLIIILPFYAAAEKFYNRKPLENIRSKLFQNC